VCRFPTVGKNETKKSDKLRKSNIRLTLAGGKIGFWNKFSVAVNVDIKNYMKAKMISLISGVALVAGLAVSPAALASTSAEVTQALAGSTALDLPAKTAALVAQAAPADKQGVAIAAVKAAVKLNPSVASEIVSAVAKENSSLAPVVAVTAAKVQHKQIGLITKAAAAAAPSEAANIVAAMIKEFPSDYGVIAIAASKGAPDARKEILATLAKCVPGMEAIVQSLNADVPVQVVVNQAVAAGNMPVAMAPQPTLPTVPATPELSGPPTLGSPFQAGGTPTVYTTDTPVSSGGRHYAAP
jgi:hypothetical protein